MNSPVQSRNLLVMTMLDQRAVEVAVALPVRGTFTYAVPEALGSRARAGKRVLVPFGRRKATGYILDTETAGDQKDIKPILDVLDDSPIFPASMIPFFRWTAEYYKHPIGEVIRTALPAGLTISESAVLELTEEGRRYLQGNEAAPLEARLLGLLARGGRRERDLRLRLGGAFRLPALSSLIRRGHVIKELSLKGGSAGPLLQRMVRLRAPLPDGLRLSGKKRTILNALEPAGALPVSELNTQVPHAASHLRTLQESGYVDIYHRRLYRDPLGEPIKPDHPPVLTTDQEKAAAAVCAALGKGFRTFLLKGVTGSGKTEVYLRVTAEALKAGLSVLVLVPEIALITQTESRFRARFGGSVAVLHSGLSQGERFDQWTRILQREIGIAIGARSAAFAPFGALGLIVVDEEHDASYKQDGGLHYNARDLAVVRARQDACVALLGSATPSLQSHFNARSGKYWELNLPKRVEQRPLPEIQVVDLRKCRDLRGPGRFISAELNHAMAAALERGEQVLLFLNRRGFANFPVCAACGTPLRCRHCDISLTLHQAASAYRCHYCGFSLPSTSRCQACGSDKIKRLGMGTEKVESAVRSLFPKARVARMDRDTTRRRGDLLKLLKGLRERTTDVMVGTQIVAKGHDFPNITLVGIICADLSLSFPDFRAGEQTFQLLAQVAGRAGRGDRPGRVILQTYNPDHFSIQAARDQDYEAFYRQEMAFREALAYPPASRLIQLRISGRDPRQTRQLAETLGKQCRVLRETDPSFLSSIQVMGPIAAPLARVAGHYRWQMLLKSSGPGPLHQYMEGLLSGHPGIFAGRPARVVIDVDPIFMM